MTPNDIDDALGRELNRLYWDGDESVNQIADELEISKGTLYELLEPLATRVPCPECGEANLVYPHRTARDRGTLECPVCAADVDAEDVGSPADLDPDVPTGESSGRTGRGRHDESGMPGSSAAGVAILGLAAGVALFLLLRR